MGLIASKAALDGSGTRENAWSAGWHPESVTKTTLRMRGGAVCLPDAIIPLKPARPTDSMILWLAGLFF